MTHSVKAIVDWLTSSLGDDEEFIHEVLQEFLDTSPDLLAKIGEAVAHRDALALRAEAHALKGACRTIGAQELALLGAELEMAGKMGDLRQAEPQLARLKGEFTWLQSNLHLYLVQKAA